MFILTLLLILIFLSPVKTLAFNAGYTPVFKQVFSHQPANSIFSPFTEPRNIAFDSSDNRYILDNAGYVYKYDSNDNPAFRIGGYGDGDGQLYSPYRLAVANDGSYFYVADTYNHRVQKFDPNGNFVLKFGTYGSGDGQFNYVTSVDVDSQGNIYTTEYSNHRIQKFDANGNFIKKWGSQGSGDGQFYRAYSIKVDDSDNLFVADTYNHRIQKFNSNGDFLMKFGSQGSGDGQFSYTMDITFDAQGNLYVSDSNNHRIQKFSPLGVFISKWGGSGTASGFFNGTMGISFNSAKTLFYVCDRFNNRVQKFDLNNNFLISYQSIGTSSTEFKRPGGIAFDSQQNTYIVDTGNARIQKFNSSGNFITQIGFSGSGNGQFTSPTDVILDHQDNIFVVDVLANRIQKFDTDANYLLQWGSQGSADGQFSYPRYGAVDSSNNLYISDAVNYRIQKFNSSGSFLLKWGSQGSADGQFSYPFGIAIDSQNNVYVGDITDSRIQKFDSSGNHILTWNILDDSYSEPIVLKIDNQDNLYVGTYDGDLLIYNTQGNLIGSFGDKGISSNQQLQVIGLGIRANGDIFASDFYNHQVTLYGDTSPPSATVNLNSSSAYTNQISVSVGSTVEDNRDPSGSLFIMVSLSPSFTDAVWQSYSDTLSFDLSNNQGSQTIYTKFKDIAGNISSPISSSIIYDNVPPVASISIGSSYTNIAGINIDLSVVDTTSGPSQLLLSENSDFSGASWQNYSSAPSFTLSSSDGVKTVYAKVKDNAGNESSSVSLSLTLDTTSPAIAGLSVSPQSNGSVLSWTSAENTTTQVNYGLNSNDYSQQANSTSGLTHSVEISSLHSCTTYFYQIISTDLSGNTSTDSSSFTTQGCLGSSVSSLIKNEQIGSSASTVSVADTIDILIPQNAFNQSYNLQIKQLNPSQTLNFTSTPTANSALIESHIYELDLYSNLNQTVSTFPKNLTITIHYHNLVDIDDSTLSLYYWTGTQWQKINSTHDAVQKTVTAQTNHFSAFALFGKRPNPTQPDCTQIPPVNAPIFYSVTSTINSATLHFFHPPNDISSRSRFVIRYGDSSGNYNFGAIEIDNPQSDSYTVNFLKPNTVYYFQISSVNQCAFGPWSGEMMLKTKPIFSVNNLNTEIIESKTNSESALTVAKSDTYTVKIKIVDKKQKPLSNVKVTLHSNPREAFTDDQGLVSFEDVEPGQHQLIVDHQDYQGTQPLNLTGPVASFDLVIKVVPTHSVRQYQILAISALFLLINVIFSIFYFKKKQRL